MNMELLMEIDINYQKTSFWLVTSASYRNGLFDLKVGVKHVHLAVLSEQELFLEGVEGVVPERVHHARGGGQRRLQANLHSETTD